MLPLLKLSGKTVETWETYIYYYTCVTFMFKEGSFAISFF